MDEWMTEWANLEKFIRSHENQLIHMQTKTSSIVKQAVAEPEGIRPWHGPWSLSSLVIDFDPSSNEKSNMAYRETY